jgi:OOP family OmpA-OmpF porin
MLERLTAVTLVGVLGLTGCAAMEERRWGTCAIAGGVLGAGVGGGTAGGLVNAYGAGNQGQASEGVTAGAAVGGAIGGAVIGAVLGHLLCDPVEEAPPAPAPPPPPAPKKMILSADAFFDFNKATLKREGEVKIDEVVRAMKGDPKLRATVDGYTDSIGTEAYNQRLSERRADAVRSYMVSQGIDASRITTRGYGESHPVADNKTAEGRAKNRRVEITTE